MPIPLGIHEEKGSGVFSEKKRQNGEKTPDPFSSSGPLMIGSLKHGLDPESARVIPGLSTAHTLKQVA
jgi:hypothetical protein